MGAPHLAVPISVISRHRWSTLLKLSHSNEHYVARHNQTPEDLRLASSVRDDPAHQTHCEGPEQKRTSEPQRNQPEVASRDGKDCWHVCRTFYQLCVSTGRVARATNIIKLVFHPSGLLDTTLMPVEHAQHASQEHKRRRLKSTGIFENCFHVETRGTRVSSHPFDTDRCSWQTGSARHNMPERRCKNHPHFDLLHLWRHTVSYH